MSRGRGLRRDGAVRWRAWTFFSRQVHERQPPPDRAGVNRLGQYPRYFRQSRIGFLGDQLPDDLLVLLVDDPLRRLADRRARLESPA